MLYPVFGMVVLTFIVLFIGLAARVGAVKSGQMRPESFRLNPMEGASEKIVTTTKHFSNLFEMPVLFYLACVVCLILGLSSAALIALAWLYVTSRVVHAAIHITYNNVSHRLAAFAVSNLALLGMWAIILANTL
jgi:hypothetical protein